MKTSKFIQKITAQARHAANNLLNKKPVAATKPKQTWSGTPASPPC